MQENTFWRNWIRPDGIDDLEAFGFVGDLSSSDNACPSWSHRNIPVRIWVDLPLGSSEVTNDPGEWYQYAAETFSYDPEVTPQILVTTNDITDVIDLIKNTPDEMEEKEANCQGENDCDCTFPHCPMCASSNLRFINPPGIGDQESMYCNNCQKEV